MMLPEGWSQVQFGEIAEFKNGLNFDKEDEGQAIKVVGIPDFWQRTTLTNFSQLKKIISRGEIQNSFLLQTGDLLFVRSNGNPALVGRCLFFPEVNEPISFSGFTIRGRVNTKRILPKFAANLLASDIAKDQIRRGGGGTNISNVSQDILAGIPIRLPPLAEQQKIAEILSVWDHAIEVVEKLIANAKAQKKALMQTLLTGKKRLPGYKEEWKKLALSKLANITMGSSPPSTAYNDLGIGIPLIQGNADIRNRRTAPRAYTSDITQTCEIGDIIFSVRAPVGEVSVSEHHACLGRGVAAIRVKDDNDFDFIFQSLLSTEDRWVSLSQGSTFQAVNSKELKNFELVSPVDPKERLAIGTVLHNYGQNLEILNKQVNVLRQEKSALMQQLLTGKRRVKVEDVL